MRSTEYYCKLKACKEHFIKITKPPAFIMRREGKRIGFSARGKRMRIGIYYTHLKV
jgi:hypothetical protein